MNRSVLVRLVMRHPGTPKAELARLTNVTKATVGLLVEELIREGWLRAGSAVANGTGRPTTPLYLNPDLFLLIGAEVGVDYRNVVAINLLGEVVGRRYTAVKTGAPAAAFTSLAQDVKHLTEELPGRPILGLGIGLPGPVELGTDTLVVAANIGWRDVPAQALMVQALRDVHLSTLPLLLENEANAGAMAEYMFGVRAANELLVYLSIGIGVGGGIILNDGVFLGLQGYAGEVGHITLVPDGPICTCGRRGCAKALIGQRAISKNLTGHDHLSADELRNFVSAHPALARPVLLEVGRYIGMLAGILIGTINPRSVVIGGPMAELGDLLITAASQEAALFSAPVPFEQVDIFAGRFGRDACAIGAAGEVLHALLSPTASGGRQLHIPHP